MTAVLLLLQSGNSASDYAKMAENDAIIELLVRSVRACVFMGTRGGAAAVCLFTE